MRKWFNSELITSWVKAAVGLGRREDYRMSPLNVSLLVLAFCLLLQCGDVKPNPGPTSKNYACSK